MKQTKTPAATPTIGVIADTHGLLRDEAVEQLKGSDLILHAGDVGKPQVLDALRELAPVHAVRGNVDRGAWAEDLPLREVLTIETQALCMLHILEDLEVDPAAAGFSVVIFGHTHQPKIEQRGGVLYFNPGSAGPRRFKLPVTIGRLTFPGGKPSADLIRLDGEEGLTGD
jgi:uncharacterized protein